MKNTKIFMWFDKGTKAQVFAKKLLAAAVIGCMMYFAGYGIGTLLRVMGL